MHFGEPEKFFFHWKPIGLSAQFLSCLNKRLWFILAIQKKIEWKFYSDIFKLFNRAIVFIWIFNVL